MSLTSAQLSDIAPQHQAMRDNTEEQQEIDGQSSSNSHSNNQRIGTIADVTQPPSVDTSRNYAHPHSQHDSPLLTSSNAAPTTTTTTTTTSSKQHDYSGNPPPPELQPQSLRAPVNIENRFKTTNGKTLIQVRPGWEMRVAMLPLCCFLGCFSYSIDLLFDDNTRECTIDTWQGLGCCRSAKVIPYGEIANFALKRVGWGGQGRAINYAICLVTKGGDIYRVSESSTQEDLEEDLLAYHAFIFGRGNPSTYRQPYLHELILPDRDTQ